MANLDLYNQYRPLMKTGDLLTYRTYGVVSTLIHIWSHFNHAGMVLDLSEYQGEEQRKWTLEAVAGGPQVAFLSKVLEKTHGEVWWHPLHPEYDELRNEIGCFALEYVGVTGYDFWSLIRYPFQVVSADLNKLICSEYVFLSWQKAGIVSGTSIPTPSELPEMGVTGTPTLVYKSEPVEPHPVVGA